MREPNAVLAFSPATLAKFEDASAGIPLRPLIRAFESVGMRPGDDPGGVDGARKVQFRRYVASVDQTDATERDRLGSALGILVGEVADSKVEFLVRAAESDGFTFEDGRFRPAQISPHVFELASIADFRLLEDRLKRLDLLANDRPYDAIAGAAALVDSVCRSVLRAHSEPNPKRTASLTTVATATLESLDVGELDALAALAALLERIRSRKTALPRDARLAVDTSGAFVRFVADVCTSEHRSNGFTGPAFGNILET